MVGMEIFRGTQTHRPFMVLLPNPCVTSWSNKEPDFVQLCQASRALLSNLFVYSRDVDTALQERLPLLCRGAQCYWQGHSDRATLPTLAAAVGISKERRDRLGRWKPSESDE